MIVADRPRRTPFGRALADALSRRGERMGDFARRMGVSGSFVSCVCTGARKPPLSRIDEWADALELAGDERGRFVLLAHLEHATPLLRRHLRRYRRIVRLLARRGVHLDDLHLEQLLVHDVALAAEEE